MFNGSSGCRVVLGHFLFLDALQFGIPFSVSLENYVNLPEICFVFFTLIMSPF